MPIYTPSEDSYFLSKFVREIADKEKPKKVLDMGSGSGIQGETALKSGIKQKDLTLADKDEDAVKVLKKKFPKSEVVYSDLFKNIKEKYDLIIFNPPYLPRDKFDKEKDTTGGKKGSEIINIFLKKAKEYLTKKGSILLLTSSFTEGIDYRDYRKEILGEENLFFEKLSIWRLFI